MFSFGKKAPAPLSIDEELDRIGAGRFHVFTLVACNHAQQHPPVLGLNRFMREAQGAMLWEKHAHHRNVTRHQVFLVDREPSTINEAVTLADREGYGVNGTEMRCEGFHAYGDVVLHHAYLALSQYEAALCSPHWAQ